MGRETGKPGARIYVARAEELVLGKDSSAWSTWWNLYMRHGMHNHCAEYLHTGCLAVLLSLGAPPHPEYLTQDTQDATIKPPHRGSDEYSKWMREEHNKQQRQWPWNRRFNQWAISHQMHGNNKVHGPAQFRKFFAAWLHACKEIDGEQQTIQKGA